jgi:hypothetical protein
MIIKNKIITMLITTCLVALMFVMSATAVAANPAFNDVRSVNGLQDALTYASAEENEIVNIHITQNIDIDGALTIPPNVCVFIDNVQLRFTPGSTLVNNGIIVINSNGKLNPRGAFNYEGNGQVCDSTKNNNGIAGSAPNVSLERVANPCLVTLEISGKFYGRVCVDKGSIYDAPSMVTIPETKFGWYIKGTEIEWRNGEVYEDTVLVGESKPITYNLFVRYYVQDKNANYAWVLTKECVTVQVAINGAYLADLNSAINNMQEWYTITIDDNGIPQSGQRLQPDENLPIHIDGNRLVVMAGIKTQDQ